MGNADSGNKSAIHWAWIILAVCFVNLFINYGIRLGYGVVMPEMIRTLGFHGGRQEISSMHTSLLISASPYLLET